MFFKCLSAFIYIFHKYKIIFIASDYKNNMYSKRNMVVKDHPSDLPPLNYITHTLLIISNYNFVPRQSHLKTYLKNFPIVCSVTFHFKLGQISIQFHFIEVFCDFTAFTLILVSTSFDLG